MEIAVCVKQTFDTEARITVTDDAVRADGSALIMNPYDEYAVEAAVRLKESFGGAVTVITVGPPRAEDALRTALAMGADEAVLVEYDGGLGAEQPVSELLAAVIRRRSYDLILAGNQAIDGGSGQVAIRAAELLGIAHIGAVTRLEVNGALVTAERDADGDIEVMEGELPLLVTAQQGLNEPRYPSLIGIRKAAKKPVGRLTPEALGLSVGQEGKQARIAGLSPAPAKAAGILLQGDTAQRVHELVTALRDTHKLI